MLPEGAFILQKTHCQSVVGVDVSYDRTTNLSILADGFCQDYCYLFFGSCFLRCSSSVFVLLYRKSLCGKERFIQVIKITMS